MTYSKILVFCLFLSVLFLAGCSSNTSTNSGFGSGSGYTIDLRATQTMLPQGGSAIIIASVKDSQGNPVNDSSRGLIFTSSQGANITAEEFINLGVCNATYTAPATITASVVVDQITASYQGAFAFVSIEVFKQ